MDQEDLKAFEKILKKNLKNELKIELTPLKSQVNEMQETLDSHTVSLMKIEKEIGAYKEGLKLQGEKVSDHETRLTKVEENLNLNN